MNASDSYHQAVATNAREDQSERSRAGQSQGKRERERDIRRPLLEEAYTVHRVPREDLRVKVLAGAFYSQSRGKVEDGAVAVGGQLAESLAESSNSNKEQDAPGSRNTEGPEDLSVAHLTTTLTNYRDAEVNYS